MAEFERSSSITAVIRCRTMKYFKLYSTVTSVTHVNFNSRVNWNVYDFLHLQKKGKSMRYLSDSPSQSKLETSPLCNALETSTATFIRSNISGKQSLSLKTGLGDNFRTWSSNKFSYNKFVTTIHESIQNIGQLEILMGMRDLKGEYLIGTVAFMMIIRLIWLVMVEERELIVTAAVVSVWNIRMEIIHYCWKEIINLPQVPCGATNHAMEKIGSAAS